MPHRDYQKQLGQAIRALRIDRGLKQTELAGAARVTESQISHIERGEFWPSLQTLIAIGERLGVQVSDMFSFERTSKDDARADAQIKLLALTSGLTADEVLWATELIKAALKRPTKSPKGR